MMRRGISTVGIVASVIFIMVGGLWFIFAGDVGGGSSKIFSGELYEVATGSFDIAVPTSGELAAEKQIKIHNHLVHIRYVTFQRNRFFLSRKSSLSMKVPMSMRVTSCLN